MRKKKIQQVGGNVISLEIIWFQRDILSNHFNLKIRFLFLPLLPSLSIYQFLQRQDK